MVSTAFLWCPGKSARAEWHGSFSLDEMYDFNIPMADRTELQHIDPHSIGHNCVSFPFSWAAQPVAWGPCLSGTCSSIQHLLSNSSDPQLSWSPTAQSGIPRAPSAGCSFLYSIISPTLLNFLCTELYNSSTSTFFLWASQIALIQPVHGQGYNILIFLDRIHLLFW